MWKIKWMKIFHLFYSVFVVFSDWALIKLGDIRLMCESLNFNSFRIEQNRQAGNMRIFHLPIEVLWVGFFKRKSWQRRKKLTTGFMFVDSFSFNLPQNCTFSTVYFVFHEKNQQICTTQTMHTFCTVKFSIFTKFFFHYLSKHIRNVNACDGALMRKYENKVTQLCGKLAKFGRFAYNSINRCVIFNIRRDRWRRIQFHVHVKNRKIHRFTIALWILNLKMIAITYIKFYIAIASRNDIHLRQWDFVSWANECGIFV